MPSLFCTEFVFHFLWHCGNCSTSGVRKKRFIRIRAKNITRKKESGNYYISLMFEWRYTSTNFGHFSALRKTSENTIIIFRSIFVPSPYVLIIADLTFHWSRHLGNSFTIQFHIGKHIWIRARNWQKLEIFESVYWCNVETWKYSRKILTW